MILPSIGAFIAFVGFVLNIAAHDWETACWAFTSFMWALGAAGR